MIVTKDGEELSSILLCTEERMFIGVKGKKGAVILSVWKSMKDYSLNYHAHNPQLSGVSISDSDCEFIGAPCYCDGRNADYLFKDKTNVDIIKILVGEYECLK